MDNGSSVNIYDSSGIEKKKYNKGESAMFSVNSQLEIMVEPGQKIKFNSSPEDTISKSITICLDDEKIEKMRLLGKLLCENSQDSFMSYDNNILSYIFERMEIKFKVFSITLFSETVEELIKENSELNHKDNPKSDTQIKKSENDE